MFFDTFFFTFFHTFFLINFASVENYSDFVGFICFVNVVHGQIDASVAFIWLLWGYLWSYLWEVGEILRLFGGLYCRGLDKCLIIQPRNQLFE